MGRILVTSASNLLTIRVSSSDRGKVTIPLDTIRSRKYTRLCNDFGFRVLGSRHSARFVHCCSKEDGNNHSSDDPERSISWRRGGESEASDGAEVIRLRRENSELRASLAELSRSLASISAAVAEVSRAVQLVANAVDCGPPSENGVLGVDAPPEISVTEVCQSSLQFLLLLMHGWFDPICRICVLRPLFVRSH